MEEIATWFATDVGATVLNVVASIGGLGGLVAAAWIYHTYYQRQYQERLEHDLAQARANDERADSMNAEYKEQVQGLLQEFKQERNRLSSEVKKMRKERREERRHFEAERRLLKERHAKREDILLGRLEQMSEELRQTEASLANLSQDHVKAWRQIQTLQKRVVRTESELEDARQELKQSRASERECEKRCQRLEHQVKKLRQEVGSLEERSGSWEDSNG